MLNSCRCLSLSAACPTPFTLTDADGRPVSGFAHLGALMAATWLFESLHPILEEALLANKGYTLQLTGHSIGGACASMLAIM